MQQQTKHCRQHATRNLQLATCCVYVRQKWKAEHKWKFQPRKAKDENARFSHTTSSVCICALQQQQPKYLRASIFIHIPECVCVCVYVYFWLHAFGGAAAAIDAAAAFWTFDFPIKWSEIFMRILLSVAAVTSKRMVVRIRCDRLKVRVLRVWFAANISVEMCFWASVLTRRMSEVNNNLR